MLNNIETQIKELNENMKNLIKVLTGISEELGEIRVSLDGQLSEIQQTIHDPDHITDFTIPDEPDDLISPENDIKNKNRS